MMYLMLRPIFFIFCFVYTVSIHGQDSEVIYVKNPSFEGIAGPGQAPNHWSDCGYINETPPDIQPYGGFNVTRPAFNGKTYIGLVTRDNNTWESITQYLSSPLVQGTCYKVSLYACMSPVYISPTKKNQSVPVNFNKGIVLRLWGSNGRCEKTELLSSINQAVDHTDWRSYEFELKPTLSTYTHLVIEAYYKTPTLSYYNGNILVDNMSEIVECNVPSTIIASSDTIVTDPEPKEKDIVKNDNNNPVNNNTTEVVPNTPIKNTIKGNFIADKIEPKDIEIGDIYRLEELRFEADSFNINRSSERYLYSVYVFLQKNKNLRVEIGGHTNGLPSHSYCDNLSLKRARSVRLYLITKGIIPSRISYRGYGKRKPISDNETVEGRRKNQRVEMLITNV